MKSLQTYVNESIMFQKKRELSGTLKISFVGDIMQHEKQLRSEASRNWSYSGTFDDVSELLQNSNHVIGNLETTIGDDKNSGFPNFSAPVEFLTALKKAGFNTLVTCNNHTYDNDDRSIEQTYTKIIESGMTPVGTCDSKLIHVQKDDILVTIHVATDIMNNSYNGELDIAQEQNPLISYYHTDNMNVYDEMHGLNIAFIHCGKEYSEKATDRQNMIRSELQQKGFDAVLFCHSHVPGDKETLRYRQSNSKPIWVSYGSGNFISDQKNLDRQIGEIITMTFQSNKIVEIEVIKTETIWKDGFSKVVFLN